MHEGFLLNSRPCRRRKGVGATKDGGCSGVEKGRRVWAEARRSVLLDLGRHDAAHDEGLETPELLLGADLDHVPARQASREALERAVLELRRLVRVVYGERTVDDLHAPQLDALEEAAFEKTFVEVKATCVDRGESAVVEDAVIEIRVRQATRAKVALLEPDIVHPDAREVKLPEFLDFNRDPAVFRTLLGGERDLGQFQLVLELVELLVVIVDQSLDHQFERRHVSSSVDSVGGGESPTFSLDDQASRIQQP